jgi:hypothetical protein
MLWLVLEVHKGGRALDVTHHGITYVTLSVDSCGKAIM